MLLWLFKIIVFLLFFLDSLIKFFILINDFKNEYLVVLYKFINLFI